MIKKIKSLIIVFLLILPMAFIFVGCNNNEEDNNSNGNNSQIESPDPVVPVEGTYRLTLDYGLPDKLSELFINIDETRSTKTSYILPTFTGTNLNDYFEGWYNKSDDSKIEKSWVLGTNGQTISVYGKWKDDISNYYFTEGLKFELSSDLSTASVSEYSGNSKVIVLPKNINFDNQTYLVTEICENVFENLNIDKVIFLGDEISISSNAFNNSKIGYFDFSAVSIIDNFAFANTNINCVKFSNRLKQIGSNAFLNCNKLIEVDFSRCSADIETISSNSFLNCNNLSLVRLSTYIKTIETKAFKNCKQLKTLDLGNLSIVNIESEAFANSGLTTLALPESLLNVGLNAFSGLENLNSISLGNLFYDNSQSMNGVFGTTISSIKSITLTGSKITEIRSNYFSECTSLETFIMNDSITTIQRYAFKNCTNLLNIEFSNGILGNNFDSNAFFDTAWYKNNDQIIIRNNAVLIVPLGCSAILDSQDFENVSTISMNAFSNNNNILKISLPASLTTISDRAFYNCQNLETVIFENGSLLTTINAQAFFNCKNLKNIDLTNCNNLKEINSYAFSNIGAIDTFIIPDSILSLGIACFENAKIKEFKVNGENTKYFTESGVLYEKFASSVGIYAYPIASEETEFVVKSNVRRIYESAFFNTTLNYIYINSKNIEFAGGSESNAFSNSDVKIIVSNNNIVIPPNNWNVYNLLSSGFVYNAETESIKLTTPTLSGNKYFVKTEVDLVERYFILHLDKGSLIWQQEITDVINSMSI